MNKPEETMVSGWREWLSLPDINLPGLEATIDTGTESSILHTTFIEHYRQGGDLWVRFGVNPLPLKDEIRIVCQAPVKNHIPIQTSDFHDENLFVIESTVTLGDRSHLAEVVLHRTQNERYPFHLGRNALQALGLLVDPSRTHHLGRPDESIYNHQLRAS
jgi:hypothetical protein